MVTITIKGMTRRQYRYAKLKTLAFLPFEARELSKVPFKTPYLRLGIRERRDALRTALREYKARGFKFSKAEWLEIVNEMYIARGWMRDGIADPWQMLRAWEERYRARHPEYDSPPRPKKIKKQRKGEFASKYAKGLADYERGRYR